MNPAQLLYTTLKNLAMGIVDCSIARKMFHYVGKTDIDTCEVCTIDKR